MGKVSRRRVQIKRGGLNMAGLDGISGLMDDGNNEAYQRHVTNEVFRALVSALRHPDTNQVLFRNEDVILGLMDIQAILLTTSKETDTPTKLRKWCDEFAKTLRRKAVAARDAEAEQGSIF
jgi:hypothetical protein